MSLGERFNPRLIQAEYLRATDFRSRLIYVVEEAAHDLGAVGDRERLWLRRMRQLLVPPQKLDEYHPWTKRYANAIIERYGLGRHL